MCPKHTTILTQLCIGRFFQLSSQLSTLRCLSNLAVCSLLLAQDILPGPPQINNAQITVTNVTHKSWIWSQKLSVTSRGCTSTLTFKPLSRHSTRISLLLDLCPELSPAAVACVLGAALAGHQLNSLFLCWLLASLGTVGP